MNDYKITMQNICVLVSSIQRGKNEFKEAKKN